MKMHMCQLLLKNLVEMETKILEMGWFDSQLAYSACCVDIYCFGAVPTVQQIYSRMHLDNIGEHLQICRTHVDYGNEHSTRELDYQ